MKTIQVPVKESVWKLFLRAGKTKGISVAKLLEQSAMESKAVKSIIKSDQPPAERKGNAKRIVDLLGRNGPLDYRAIVECLEPIKELFGKDPERKARREDERYRRGLIRAAIGRLLGNGILQKDELEKISLAKQVK